MSINIVMWCFFTAPEGHQHLHNVETGTKLLHLNDFSGTSFRGLFPPSISPVSVPCLFGTSPMNRTSHHIEWAPQRITFDLKYAVRSVSGSFAVSRSTVACG